MIAKNKESQMIKNKRTWGISALLALGIVTSALAQHTSGEAEKAVLALENQWLQSERVNNPDLITSIISEKYVATGGDGALQDKAQMLADAKDRKYSSVEYENVKATSFGDTTVVVTGGYKGKGTESAGKTFDEHLRWTDTWVKVDGKWVLVASQYSPIKP
jgi:hypothetical protein